MEAKPKTKIITGCIDCPMHSMDGEMGDHTCGYDLGIIIYPASVINDTPVTPSDCPLKTQPILITYEP